jgi:hypothetical protein
MIKVENNDSNICNLVQVVQQIAQHMHKNMPVIVLNTNSEGPCATSLGLYDLLDTLCLKYNYPKQKIAIQTCNLLEKHSQYTINRIPQFMYLLSARRYQTPAYNKTFDKDFKHFGNFIGHGNLHRLHLASYLYSNQQSHTCQTYHCDPTMDYHRKHIGLEDMLHAGYDVDTVNQALELIKHSPLTIDAIDQYPILNPTTLNITKIYPGFFVELVNLTYFTGNTFYVDEKIWRPMLMRTPFIVQGPQNFLHNLQRLGFQTFDRWWPEGYSQDPSNSQVHSIIPVVENLSRLTVTELKDLYTDMQPVLEHNYQRLFQITKPDFMKAFDVAS